MATLEKASTINNDVILLLDRENCVYTSNYCEENVWLMCDYVRKTQHQLIPSLYVVFISNENQIIPLWEQKAGGEDKVVLWDYHVILLHRNERHSTIYDLDSTLPFPVDFVEYSSKAIRSDNNVPVSYRRKFRVIPADEFLTTFSSDRSHMKNSDGSFKALPPNYPCIQTPECENNIEEFISMDSKLGIGKVLNSEDFNRMALNTTE